MGKKICFVIMGFGKKTDYITGRTLDLDKTYLNIIKPAVEKSGYTCVRADEIQDSGLIDKSMYALLMHADLVIADISTYNPNAIYELGIRHGVRPYSTIIIKEKEGKIPFDIDHNRIFTYTHLGEDIGTDEAARCKEILSILIAQITKNEKIDSPLYEFIRDINPPSLPEEEYVGIINELAKNEKSVFALVEKAKKSMLEKNMEEAAKHWIKVSEKMPNETYFIQQAALCTYKKQNPPKDIDLIDALAILDKISDTDETINDPETLGIKGAIYKNYYISTNNKDFLVRAIECYQKGYSFRGDYYTGENYASCLDLMAKIEKINEEKIYLKITAKKIREKIVKNLLDLLDRQEIDDKSEKKWTYATLANCYFNLNNSENGEAYEKLFLDEKPLSWEKDTYYNNKNKNFKGV